MTLEISINKAIQPKTHAVNPETLKMDSSRSPSNIPSLKKPTQHKPKKYQAKRFEDDRSDLQRLFAKDKGEAKDIPIPAPPKDISEAELVIQQVMDELKNRPRKISEMI